MPPKKKTRAAKRPHDLSESDELQWATKANSGSDISSLQAASSAGLAAFMRGGGRRNGRADTKSAGGAAAGASSSGSASVGGSAAAPRPIDLIDGSDESGDDVSEEEYEEESEDDPSSDNDEDVAVWESESGAAGVVARGTAGKAAASSSGAAVIKHGTQIEDNRSIFQAHLAPARSVAEAKAVLRALRNDAYYQSADHHVAAYRVSPRPGSGSDGLVEVSDDDGEDRAGGKLLGVLRRYNAANVVVVVNRWWGGQNLGPKRFAHICRCAIELLQSQGYHAEGGGPSPASAGAASAKSRGLDSEVQKVTLLALLASRIVLARRALNPTAASRVIEVLSQHASCATALGDLGDSLRSGSLLRLTTGLHHFLTRGQPNYFSPSARHWANAHHSGGGGGGSEDFTAPLLGLRHCGAAECALLMLAACRGLGLTARLVSPLDPHASAANGSAALAETSLQRRRKPQSEVLKRLARGRAVGKVDGSKARGKADRAAIAQHAPGGGGAAADVAAWVEVFSEAEGRWLAADPVHARADEPLEILRQWAPDPHHQPPYVVAVEFAEAGGNGGLRVRDVSRRYLQQWHVENLGAGSKRVSQKWWDGVLDELSGGGGGGAAEGRQGSGSESTATAAAAAREEVDEVHMEAAAVDNARGKLPTTQAACKSSPLYVLPTQLPARQQVRPSSRPVGYLNGKPIHNRSDVSDLLSRRDWLRKRARVVLAAAVAAPFKTVAARRRPLRMHGGVVPQSQPGAGDRVELYGDWQTEPYRAPAAVGARVPRNAYGNWELWQRRPEFLPRGCRYIDMPYIGSSARDVGVDYVEAVIDFEYRASANKSMPKVSGIIVCAEDAGRVLAQHEQRTAAREAKEQKKRDAEVLRLWRELIVAAERREYVFAEYSGGD